MSSRQCDLAGQQAPVARAPRSARRALMPCWREVSIDSPTVLTIRTGRPALRARAMVSGSMRVYDLEPKPPPRKGTMIRTRAERHAEHGRHLGPHQERVLAVGPHRDLPGLDLGDARRASPSSTGRPRGTCTRPPRPRRRRANAASSSPVRSRSGSRGCPPARAELPGRERPLAERALVHQGRVRRRRPPRPCRRPAAPRTRPGSARSAASAWASVTAATAATGSPAKRTRSIATIGRSRIAWP